MKLADLLPAFKMNLLGAAGAAISPYTPEGMSHRGKNTLDLMRGSHRHNADLPLKAKKVSKWNPVTGKRTDIHPPSILRDFGMHHASGMEKGALSKSTVTGPVKKPGFLARMQGKINSAADKAIFNPVSQMDVGAKLKGLGRGLMKRVIRASEERQYERVLSEILESHKEG